MDLHPCFSPAHNTNRLTLLQLNLNADRFTCLGYIMHKIAVTGTLYGNMLNSQSCFYIHL
jgi:hypothetical protein